MRLNPPGLRTFVALLLVAAALTFTSGALAERWGTGAAHGPATGDETDAHATDGEAADDHAETVEDGEHAAETATTDAHDEATPAAETHEEAGVTDDHAEGTPATDPHAEPAGEADEAHAASTADADHAADGTAAAGADESHDDGAAEAGDTHAEDDAHADEEAHTFLGISTRSNGFLALVVAASLLLAAALVWRPHPALLVAAIAFGLVLAVFDLEAAFNATAAQGFPVPLGALSVILHLGAAALAALALAEHRAPALTAEHA